jgi:glycosyltransferase involved in cell wall biosynthesis
MLGKTFIFDQHDLCPEVWLSRNGDVNGDLYHKLLLALERASYRCADVVISTNETYKEVAITRGRKNPNEVFIVRNGPDLRKFQPVRAREDLRTNGEVLVGYLGNMNPQDGASYLLETASEIVKRHGRSNISFVLIGGGSQQQRLLQRSREMGLEGNVTFTGRISDEEMLARLSSCSICVQPDPLNPLNDKSTMNKAMEYMALGKPVVAFDLKETRVSCGDTALYATPNDVKDLADKILCLADNLALRLELGNKARHRVERELSWSYSVPNLLAAYEYAIR